MTITLKISDNTKEKMIEYFKDKKIRSCKKQLRSKKAYQSILKRFLNLSTRPPVSTNFCLPVKNG